MDLKCACLLSGLVLLCLPARLMAQEVPGESRTKPVTLTMLDEALSTVLSALDRQSGTRLRAERKIADFRLSVFAKDRPLSRVMDDLVWLLEHGYDPQGFVWLREKTRDDYLLVRSLNSVKREEEARNLPRTRAEKWLRELRQAYRLSGDERTRFAEGADSPYFLRPIDAVEAPGD